MNLYWDTVDTFETYHFALGANTERLESGSHVVRALHDNRDADQVIIGPTVALDTATATAEEIRLDRPDVGVILIRQRLDVATLSQALRSGVREVVASDDHSALVEALRRSRELTARLAGSDAIGGSRSGKVITVFSAKGGVGKTTMSTNIAAHLAKEGKRTLLVDLDLAFGDVGISLHLAPTRTISDARAMGGNLDLEGLSSLVTKHEVSGLDVLAAPHDPSDADRIPTAVVAEILRVARSQYEYIVVDTPPSFTEQVLTACDLSDLLILIATLDIPAVKNLRVALDTLDTLGVSRDIRVIVLNRSDAKVGLQSEDVENALGTKINGHIPGSTSVPAAVNKGVALVVDDPKHPVSAAITQLADTHIRSRFGEQLDQGGRRRGLFRSRS